jgi:NtrC-family two-component system response regulator AlgB
VQLLPSLHALAPELEVVIITAYATIQIAVDAMQRGARDVLPKPFLLPLARRFLGFFGRSAQRTLELGAEAEPVLRGYHWPGNIRELRNAMERAAILAQGQIIGTEALPERIVAAYSGVPFLGGDFTLEQIEAEHIRRMVARCATREEAAHTLGVDPSTLWRKLKRSE